MEIIVNNNKWLIVNVKTRNLIEMYKETYGENEDVVFTYGLCKYPAHVIYINEEMCEEQRVKTLKHELTHCYIWEYGLFNVPNFTDEMVCDLVASINTWMNEVVEKYKKEMLED